LRSSSISFALLCSWLALTLFLLRAFVCGLQADGQTLLLLRAIVMLLSGDLRERRPLSEIQPLSGQTSAQSGSLLELSGFWFSALGTSGTASVRWEHAAGAHSVYS